MNVLHLTLHKRYFDAIANGTKIVEFREAKPYWTKRLFKHRWDEIHFRNGYSPTSPFMRVACRGIDNFILDGNYCIRLGKVLEITKA